MISPTPDEEAFVRCVLERELYRTGGGFAWSVAPRCELEDAGYAPIDAEEGGRGGGGEQCQSCLRIGPARSHPRAAKRALLEQRPGLLEIAHLGFDSSSGDNEAAGERRSFVDGASTVGVVGQAVHTAV